MNIRIMKIGCVCALTFYGFCSVCGQCSSPDGIESANNFLNGVSQALAAGASGTAGSIIISSPEAEIKQVFNIAAHSALSFEGKSLLTFEDSAIKKPKSSHF